MFHDSRDGATGHHVRPDLPIFPTSVIGEVAELLRVPLGQFGIAACLPRCRMEQHILHVKHREFGVLPASDRQRVSKRPLRGFREIHRTQNSMQRQHAKTSLSEELPWVTSINRVAANRITQLVVSPNSAGDVGGASMPITIRSAS